MGVAYEEIANLKLKKSPIQASMPVSLRDEEQALFVREENRYFFFYKIFIKKHTCRACFISQISSQNHLAINQYNSSHSPNCVVLISPIKPYFKATYNVASYKKL